MSEERFDRLEARFDGLETRFDGLETRFDGLESRFGGFETRLDGVVADVAVLKTDVQELQVGQTSMEERLSAQMRMLHEDTIDRLRTISEAQDAFRELARDRSNRHVNRVLDNHEHRITALEKPPPPPLIHAIRPGPAPACRSGRTGRP